MSNNSNNNSGNTSAGSPNQQPLVSGNTIVNIPVSNGSYIINYPIYTNGWAIIPPVETAVPVESIKKDSAGCNCKRCREFNEYAEPNQEDGSFICYACRRVW